MKYFDNEEQAVKAFMKLWEACFKDPELKEGLAKVNQLIWFDYTESGPNCSLYVDCRNGATIVGPGKPSENPDLTMILTADNAHLSWMSKLNPVMAITRGQIKVKGSATGLLKLAPKIKKVTVMYIQVLKELGMEDKINV
jgi:putative sterol carrier protein